MGVSGGLYQVVLLLHILTVVVGFGSLITNAAYARAARERGGAEGLAVAEASAAVTTRVSRSTFFAVPLFGILLVVLSDDTFGFDQPWVSLSFLLYLVAAVVLVAVLIPTQRQANALGAAASARSPGEGAGQRERLVRKVAAFEGVFNLLFLALLALMIFKPGS